MIRCTRSSLALKFSFFTFVGLGFRKFKIWRKFRSIKFETLWGLPKYLWRSIREEESMVVQKNCHLLLLRYESGSGFAWKRQPWTELWILWRTFARSETSACWTACQNAQKTPRWSLASCFPKVRQKDETPKETQEKERVQFDESSLWCDRKCVRWNPRLTRFCVCVAQLRWNTCGKRV